MTSDVRMTGDIGRINYFAWCMAVGRRVNRKTLKDWDEMPEVVQNAWRTAAETVIDEDWIEKGGDTVAHHKV